MTDSTHAYLCSQLQAALSDAPGGEKAWVPLRRSTVLACIEALEGASTAVALMDELRSLLNRAQWGAQAEPTDTNETTCDCAACRELEQTVSLRELPESASVDNQATAGNEISTWRTMDRQQRIECIQVALKHGERPAWMPDKRTWQRHYPEAFTVNNNGANHA